jgi:hypothetical protein
MSAFSFIEQGGSTPPATPEHAEEANISSRYGLLRYEWNDHTKRITVFPSPDFPAFAR